VCGEVPIRQCFRRWVPQIGDGDWPVVGVWARVRLGPLRSHQHNTRNPASKVPIPPVRSAAYSAGDVACGARFGAKRLGSTRSKLPESSGTPPTRKLRRRPPSMHPVQPQTSGQFAGLRRREAERDPCEGRLHRTAGPVLAPNRGESPERARRPTVIEPLEHLFEVLCG
jgi:hypothetical protein